MDQGRQGLSYLYLPPKDILLSALELARRGRSHGMLMDRVLWDLLTSQG